MPEDPLTVLYGVYRAGEVTKGPQIRALKPQLVTIRLMKALLLSEYNRLEMVDVPMPRPGAGEVLIRVEACGICGSDVHGYDGTSGRRIPPVVMGHEASGTIAALGSGAEGGGLSEGQHVTFDSTIYCGECEYCRRGEVNLCDHRQVLGVSVPDYRRAGAFAEYVTVPKHVVYAFPKELPFEHAAMVEPLAVAVHAVDLSAVKQGSDAVVIGAGTIGLLVMQAAFVAGCERVYVVDVDASRLELATQLGATAVVNAKSTDAAAEIVKLSGGGVAVALEAVGSSVTIRTAVDCVRKGGTVTLIGNVVPTAEIPLQAVVSRQLRLQGSAASAGEYPRCIEMLTSGKIDVHPLISAVGKLEEGPNWFARLHAREAGLLKVILKPEQAHE